MIAAVLVGADRTKHSTADRFHGFAGVHRYIKARKMGLTLSHVRDNCGAEVV